MDNLRSLGLDTDGHPVEHDRKTLIRYINLKLASLGYDVPTDASNREFLAVAHDLLANHRELSRLLTDHLCPADQRVQTFLDGYLAGEKLTGPLRLPNNTFVLDRHGLARELSLPVDADSHVSPTLSSYRISQGVLHNPLNDRRTTQGVFHVAEGGLPIADDKKSVPKKVYGNLLRLAFHPPADLLRLPFTTAFEHPVETFVTLLMRPMVCPEVPGVSPARTMEVRFIAPGSLVSNLDFVESIFGNAGDPDLPENDAAIDTDHWTGNTGYVILAPHLITVTKKELGLPFITAATERQKRDGMYWEKADELYNDGSPFKITARDRQGVMVTIIADNYYGYCKKEVKTQISLAANLFGGCEEEHAGGTIAFAAFNLGEEFHGDNGTVLSRGHSWSEVSSRYAGTLFDIAPEGHGIDRRYPEIIYLPENMHIELNKSRITWKHDGVDQELPLRPDYHYVHPAGYKVHLEKHPGAPSWRLVGTVAEGVYCHKPCTVSGGGKSEISKSLRDAMLFGPIFIADVEKDLVDVQAIFDRDYGDRFLNDVRPAGTSGSRPILSPERSLGSVVKLLTPSPTEFTAEYNAWVAAIPPHLRALVFIIKRFYRSEWGSDWRSHFTVDLINGHPGHELKYRGRRLVGSYLRVGLAEDGSWRTFKLRQDFVSAMKVAMEDDISASTVIASDRLPGLNREHCNDAVKIAANCEYRFFQRPDDAVIRGYDKQAESDMAMNGLFASNYEPLSLQAVTALADDAMVFSEYTEPMRDRLNTAIRKKTAWTMCSSHPRIVNGKPTKNPRYLQVRPDLVEHRASYLAHVGARLFRRLPMEIPTVFPVHAVLPGRRNNPPEPKNGIKMLAVYNPLHYQELPELVMDFVASLSGKSPSTTGWGSEGALTKGPFNAVRTTADLNNTIVSAILTGGWGFSTPAGHVGPNVRVDHDISLLVPELWCRLTMAERDPAYLIRDGHLERIADYTLDGKKVLASRLGYRITAKFVHTFMGRVFDDPASVFPEMLLRPETQDPQAFAEGIATIVDSQRTVAQSYFDDGSITEACPPLAAVLEVMAKGTWQGKPLDHPDLRALFTHTALLASDWYQERLRVKQARDQRLWTRHVSSLENFQRLPHHADVAQRLDIEGRLVRARAMQGSTKDAGYLSKLAGTIGADPMGESLQTARAAKA